MVSGTHTLGPLTVDTNVIWAWETGLWEIFAFYAM